MSILYKYATFLSQNGSDEFDKIYTPGTPTPRSGIYRCTHCSTAVTSVHPHPLPPQNHHEHKSPGLVRWQLAVWG